MRQIDRILSYDACEAFVRGFCCDNACTVPVCAGDAEIRQSLIKAMGKPADHLVIGVFDERRMVGLFSILVLEGVQYLEMLVGLSRDEAAYDEMFAYLQAHFAGYNADFVFSPENCLLRGLLRSKGAEFDIEQQTMRFVKPAPEIDTAGVALLTEETIPGYLKIHNTDLYWTGEKVIGAPERFRIYVAIADGNVVGYLDVTRSFEENEVFDLLVAKAHRRKGHGRRLLAKALEMNQPNGMMLLVNVDNEAAIRLYESMGFEKVENRNSIAAHCKVCGAD